MSAHCLEAAKSRLETIVAVAKFNITSSKGDWAKNTIAFERIGVGAQNGRGIEFWLTHINAFGDLSDFTHWCLGLEYYLAMGRIRTSYDNGGEK